MSWYPAPESDDEREERLRPEPTPPAQAPASPSDEDDKLQNSAPRRIYLDIGDQFALERVLSGGLSWQSLEGVTWSEDNATSHGVEYVRADLAAPMGAAQSAPESASPLTALVSQADAWVTWLKDPNRSLNSHAHETLASVLARLIAALRTPAQAPAAPSVGEPVALRKVRELAAKYRPPGDGWLSQTDGLMEQIIAAIGTPPAAPADHIADASKKVEAPAATEAPSDEPINSGWNRSTGTSLNPNHRAPKFDPSTAEISALRWLLNITTEFDRKDVRTRQAARLLDDYGNSGSTNRQLLESLWSKLAAPTTAAAVGASPETLCAAPPPGWICTRQIGHEGPCAARPATQAVQKEWVVANPGTATGIINMLAQQIDDLTATPVQPVPEILSDEQISRAAYAHCFKASEIAPQGVQVYLFDVKRLNAFIAALATTSSAAGEVKP